MKKTTLILLMIIGTFLTSCDKADEQNIDILVTCVSNSDCVSASFNLNENLELGAFVQNNSDLSIENVYIEYIEMGNLDFFEITIKDNTGLSNIVYDEHLIIKDVYYRLFDEYFVGTSIAIELVVELNDNDKIIYASNNLDRFFYIRSETTLEEELTIQKDLIIDLFDDFENQEVRNNLVITFFEHDDTKDSDGKGIIAIDTRDGIRMIVQENQEFGYTTKQDLEDFLQENYSTFSFTILQWNAKTE